MSIVSDLPNEIGIFFSCLSATEKGSILEHHLDTNATLKDIIQVLIDTYYSTATPTENLAFLMGRLLYFAGEYEKLNELATTSEMPSLILWQMMGQLNKGKKIPLEVLEKLNKELENSPLYCLVNFVFASYYYLLGDYKNYRIRRENIFNQCAMANNEELAGKIIYKIINCHAFALDAYYLRISNTLTISTNRIEEALDLAKTLNDRLLLAELYNTAAVIEQDKGNLQLAHQFLLRSQVIAENMGIEVLLPSIYANMGKLFLHMAQYGEALNWYNKGLAALERSKDEVKTRYVLLSDLAKLYYVSDNLPKAIAIMESVLKLLEGTQISDMSIEFQYIEFLIEAEKIDEASERLSKIESNLTTFSAAQRAHYYYLRGLLDLHNNNFGLAEEHIQKALNIADYIGNETISYDSLAVLLLVYLQKYELTHKLDDILLADRCLEDIIAYLLEKGKYGAAILLFYTRAKIKIITYNFELAYFLLNQGEKYARTHVPEMLEQYNIKYEFLRQLLETKEINDVIIQNNIDFRFELTYYLKILKKEILKQAAPTEQLPFAVLILHSSGIPIRTYFNPEIAISDDLLFGGLISSIRHLVNELFVERKVAFLSVDQGQYKILIEFYANLFSVVVVALRDSYMLRRKLHYFVEILSQKMDVSVKFSGSLSDPVAAELDSIVRNLFKLRWMDEKTIE